MKNYLEKVLLSQKSLKLLEKSGKEIVVKARYGPSKSTKLPLELNEDLAFLSAAIIGDGHIKKSKLQISIEVQDKKLVTRLIDICEKNFGRVFNIKSRDKMGKIYYYFFIDSKAIYNLLKDIFEIPSGKKSHVVKVPECIKCADKKIKVSFLLGIMATEGGKRKRGFGLSTASKELWVGLLSLFEDIGIKALKDKWTHKKYKKEYYGISFRKEDYFMLQAGMPERSNGRGLGDFSS